MKISEILRKRIKEMHYKQKVVAITIGISETTLSAKLNGHRKLYADEFRDICKVLSISADEVILESLRQKSA